MLYFRAMTWSVETLGTQVDAEILALPKDMQAAFVRLAERIEAVGLERIGQPHVKHLQDKLWEMRLTGSDGIARALCHSHRPTSNRCPHLCEEDPKDTPRRY